MHRTITLRVAIVATVSALAFIAVPGHRQRTGPTGPDRRVEAGVPTLSPTFTPLDVQNEAGRAVVERGATPHVRLGAPSPRSLCARRTRRAHTASRCSPWWAEATPAEQTRSP
jgi:hypothetical protein